jgi:hypothetical protein
MPRRNKIDLLPMKQRVAIEEFLEGRGFGDYKAAAAAVEKKFGVKLSRSALTRYGSKLESRLQVLRVATAKARAIVQELGPSAGVELGQALIRAAQSHVFDALINATAAQLGKPDLVSLGTLAATLEKTRIAEQRRADVADDKLARAARIVEPAIGDAQGPPDSRAAPGLSAEKTRQLRDVLIGSDAKSE